ncbi:carbohydrate ABC transporter permease [Paenibacillus aestuarii]|uniref:Carbohydrate ABC transporter permease n=1 Tax=Paenibacillus aestuarii TaxID=516965 RepID=A0ABW0K2L1_9BACL|nr:carbohydrate ABC transporter permease [Paenibacillus aestuarii]
MHRSTKLTVNSFAYLICLFWLIPVLWMAVMALKPETATATTLIEWLMPPYTWQNVIHVLNNPSANVVLWLGNSVVVSILSTVGVLVLSTLAAFVFSRMRFAGRSFWFWLIMIGLMVPREATLIPLYIQFRDLGLLNSYFSIIAPTLAAPFGLIIMKQFFDGIPEELFEAARMDGCGWLRTLLNIALPLCKPAMASLGIFVFLGAWNDFLWPFISVTDTNMMTIPIGLPVFRSQYMTAQAMPMAASAITSIPIILVFFFFQKFIVKGITFTGVKG